jgi:hypothetical protein
VFFKDYDNIRKYLFNKKTDTSSGNDNAELANDQNNDDDDKNRNKETHPFLILESNSSNSNDTSSEKKRTSQVRINGTELNVQYLSPLVLRKEFENIILNSEKRETEECMIDASFIREHEVIFWNFIWYFKRIGVDGGHLATILLNSRIDALRSQMSPRSEASPGEKQQQQQPSSTSVVEFDVFKFKNFIPSQTTNKPYNRHPNVITKCMWDNLKVKDDIGIHEVPLYISWLVLNYTDTHAKNKLVTVLTSGELVRFRKSSSNSRTLFKLYELVIRNIKESDVIVPFRNLLRERTRSKMNFSSIYREILFLILVALERELIDIGKNTRPIQQ